MKTGNCLIVNGHSGGRWLSLLGKVAHELGEQVLVRNESALSTDAIDQYNLVVLDPVSTSNLASAITQARQRYPKAGIAVFSADPTWQEERECYRAGANAYATQRFDHATVASTLQRVVAMTNSAR